MRVNCSKLGENKESTLENKHLNDKLFSGRIDGFTCHLYWATECPDIWTGVPVRMFLDEVNL